MKLLLDFQLKNIAHVIRGNGEMNLRNTNVHLWDIVKMDYWECRKEKVVEVILGLKTVKLGENINVDRNRRV